MFAVAATCISLVRSFQPIRLISTSYPLITFPKHLSKSLLPCPRWSCSFSSLFLQKLHKSSTSISSLAPTSRFFPRFFMSTEAPPMPSSKDNPLLKDFDFPPFDLVDANHVRPGIGALLKQLESDLVTLEKTVEPTWSKLVEPLEKILDRLQVIWGMVNHLKSVKDSLELRTAIEQVQPEKVNFQLRLGQSKPIYNAFKSIRLSPSWTTFNVEFYSSVHDTYKIPEGISSQILGGVIAFVMGIVTMIRLSRSMPKKLNEGNLYSNPMYCNSMIKGQAPGPVFPNEEFMTMMKRMAALEEKVTVLSNKPPVMPTEKEEMLNAAVSRANSLEEQLSATKKALDEALSRQEELLAYIDKKKKNKKKFFGM